MVNIIRIFLFIIPISLSAVQVTSQRQLMDFARVGDISKIDSLSAILLSQQEQSNDSLGLANALKLCGNAYFTANQEARAFELYEQAITVFLDLGEKEQAAVSSKQLARLYRNFLDLEKALLTGQRALDLFYELDQKPEIVTMLNLLASINLARGNVQEAIHQSKSGIAISRELHDQRTEAQGLLDLANAMNELRAYDSAMYYSKSSIGLYQEMKINFGEIDATLALSTAQLGLGKNVNALQNIDNALSLARKAGALKPIVRAGAIRGHVLYRLGRITEAIEQLNESMKQAKEINFKEQEIIINQLLYQAYENRDELDRAFQYLKAYQSMRDSVFNIELAKEIERLQTEFALDVKQNEVSFFRAQSELKELKLEQARIRIIVFGVVVVLVVLSLLLIFQRKSLRQNLKFTQEKARLKEEGMQALMTGEMKERERISRDLHDGLGQVLSVVRISLADSPEHERQKNMVDMAIKEMRAISHAMMPPALSRHGLIPALSEMARVINETGKIKLVTDLPESVTEISQLVKVTLYRVIQELVNNAIKYADPSEIVLAMSIENGQMKVEVSDNGKGFDPEKIKDTSGIGLKGMNSRMELIGGKIEIYSDLGEGTRANLILPLPDEISLKTH